MSYYISGKMSDGDSEETTFEGFYEAEELLVGQGHEVFNPAELDSEGGWEECLARDLLWMVDNLPIMYMLVGWEGSRGAKLEYEMALQLGLEIEYEADNN